MISLHNMEDLFQFTALIQLISAVNFANIKFRFHEKIFRLLLNVKQIHRKMFEKMENAISADIESLKGMDPFETKNNKSIKPRIDKLIKDYQQLSLDWNDQKGKYHLTKRDCIKAQGFKSFFLFISLYCIYDLVLIALLTTQYAEEARIGLFVLNSFSILVSFGFCIRTCFKKRRASESSLYTAAVILSIISIALTIIAIKNISNFDCEICNLINCISSIILPFAPCIWCFFYVAYHICYIRFPMRFRSIKISFKQWKLHRQKTELDKLCNLFSDISFPPATFG